MNNNNSKINYKSLKISLIINIIIVIFTIVASIIMFTGFKFMESKDLLQSSKLGMFKFFTVDSNIFMGIVALIFLIEEIKVLFHKKEDISYKLYILKLMATSAVALTFFTVFGYLGLIVDGGYFAMITNSNLFFHLIIPLLSMLNFILFESTDKLKFKYSLFGVVPTLIYTLFYTINVLVHIENGQVSPRYDWYWFVQGGLWQIVIVLPVMLAVSYLISALLLRFNRKVYKEVV